MEKEKDEAPFTPFTPNPSDIKKKYINENEIVFEDDEQQLNNLNNFDLNEGGYDIN